MRLDPDESPASATAVGDSNGVSRRDLLVRAGATGAALALGGVPAAGAAVRKHGRRSASLKTVVFGGDSVGVDFVPAHVFVGRAHTTALLHLYDALYTYPGGDVMKSLAPQLAAGFPKGTSGGLEFTVPLRRGVQFHDGTPFDADAVVFNYMRYIDKSHPFYDPAAVQVPNLVLLGVTNVEAVGKYNVKFTLNRHLGSFITQLTGAFAGIMSPTAVKNAGVANAGLHPVGTGPFKFVEAVKGDHITLERNDKYWGGKPAADRLVIRAIPNPGALTAALLSGDVNVSNFVDYHDVALFRKNSNFRTAYKTSVLTGYLGFNSGGVAGFNGFTNLRLRQAACFATNKQRLIALALNGFGTPGAGLNPPGSWGFNRPARNIYKTDLTKAKALVRAVGGKPKVSITTQSSGYWPQMAESLQNDWNAAGFDTTIVTRDSSVHYAQATQGKQDSFLGDATPSVFQPYNLYNNFFGCANPVRNRWGGFCDPAFDKRVAGLIASTDRAKSKKIIALLDQELLDNVYYVPLYYPTMVTIWNRALSNVAALPSHEMVLTHVTVR
jgi:peptide/nickel transport system substrate-binding protein